MGLLAIQSNAINQHLKYRTLHCLAQRRFLSQLLSKDHPVHRMRRPSIRIAIASSILMFSYYLNTSFDLSFLNPTDYFKKNVIYSDTPANSNNNSNNNNSGTTLFTSFSIRNDSNSSNINSTASNAYFSTYSNSQKDYNKQSIDLLSDDQFLNILRKHEESFNINRNNGVLRYDISQLPSNNPVEDDRSEKIVQIPYNDNDNNKNSNNVMDWMLWGIYDGHAGWTTSNYLKNHLLDTIINELSVAYLEKSSSPSSPSSPPPPFPSAYQIKNFESPSHLSNSIDTAIKLGFLISDDILINKNIQSLFSISDKNLRTSTAAELLMPALSGSCGLVSFYDSNSKLLKIAVTGDSRAILGSFDDNWTVEALSIDQTGSNPHEAQRIRHAHPGEKNVISRGRVLGSLEPTRAFGDARYKWTSDLQDKITKNFFGRKYSENLKTPPYVTAEPVIQSKKIDPKTHKFLVLATDGLYELLSNEEIAGLVIRWMQRKNFNNIQSSVSKSNSSSASKLGWNLLHPFSSNTSAENIKQLPNVTDVTDKEQSAFLKPPFRSKSDNKLQNEIFLDDENCATHLIRNALTNCNTKNIDQGKMLLSVPSPWSRRYRDDLTVTVIFFGDQDSISHKINIDGKIESNLEATKGGRSSPKL
ncbi:type 2C protein phosphatase PTC5 [Ascoidea rubescens DSM 1968]|uniref:Protein serine/threonine phosphatase 2C n=1 Tax=Ascoidea rubescens DSM 1968 TaxID=1344418 RepID=A0A1D2VBP5_9ASCO|nr:protein serine/threonine phosphatase 2C [Ascoidea rubescens DSM 1968]ODV59056.1 protein serine/threonine phosphatase 2C [Ascoidea rubescens DSM 1968]